MQVSLLKKTGGARLNNVQSYKVVCDEPMNKLVLSKTYKSGNEVGSHDMDFVHVAKGTINRNKNDIIACVVKVHSSRNLFLKREIDIMKHMHDNLNIVQYICHFSCKDQKAGLMAPLIKKWIPCVSDGTDDMTYIIMEFVEGGNVGDFLKQCSVDAKVVVSMFNQVAHIIIEMGVKYKVYHGDLNSGNILVKSTKMSKQRFTIDGTTYVYETHGFRPVFIDFGRGGFYEKTAKNNKLICEDILTCWSVMVAWVHDVSLKQRLNEIILELSSRKRLKYDDICNGIKYSCT